MSGQLSIGIAGSGRVASALARCLSKSHYDVSYIFSRNIDTGKQLADELNCIFTNTLEGKKQLITTNIWILAVHDDAVASVCENLSNYFPEALFLHCSGAFETKILKQFTSSYGLMYPLQSFSNLLNTDFSKIHFFVDSGKESDLPAITELAKVFSNHVHRISEEQRQVLHLAAVFANNFSNLMYRITYDIADKQDIDMSVFYPLILETALKTERMNPHTAQTGPAQRHDSHTLEKHLALLKKYPDSFTVLYRLCTDIIQNFPKDSK